MDFRLPNGRPQPGLRFAPTDVELAMFYLKRKVLGKNLYNELITEVDIYKFHPQDLPDMACACLKKELNWYFFCPRSRKYGTGERTNRATEFGFWKATGEDRVISYKNQPVAMIKTLVFHKGKPPRGERTDWVMHEYRLNLNNKDLADRGITQDSFVLCKIFKKHGLGPQNGMQYGAPFIEEEYEDDGAVAGVSHCQNMEATVAADNQNDSAVSITETVIGAQNQSASALTGCSGLCSGTPFVFPHPFTPEQVYSGAVSGVVDQASTPVSRGDVASTSKDVQISDYCDICTQNQSASALNGCSGQDSGAPVVFPHPSTSEQVCSGPVSGMVDQAPTPVSKGNFTSTSKDVHISDYDDIDNSLAAFTDIYEGLLDLSEWEPYGGLGLSDLDNADAP